MKHKYLLKTFNNRSNKKEYNSQIQEHNVYYINIIVIKDMVVVIERDGKNKEQLVIKNLLDKTLMAEVVKVPSVIDLSNK